MDGFTACPKRTPRAALRLLRNSSFPVTLVCLVPVLTYPDIDNQWNIQFGR
jgi:hypothetical protein